MMRRRSFRLVAILLAGVAAIGLAITAVVARGTFDDGATHAVVNPAEITPLPFYGYPATIEVPDYANPPKCQFPADERPSPNLPPLSCRNSGAEPTPGAIPTAPPQARPDVSSPAPGTRTIDNAIFRFTVTIPNDWYSDMRPEGGAFRLTDPTATSELMDTSINPAGGVMMQFSARSVVLPRKTDGFLPVVETKLRTPTDTLGQTPVVIWDEGPGEGAAAQLHAAFERDGIVFEVIANVADDGRDKIYIQTDIDQARATLLSVQPY